MADLPEGFLYRPDLITADEEQELIEHVRALEFAEVKMHGVVARRRVAHFGWLYAFDSWEIAPGPPLPEFLLPARARLAELIAVEPERLAEALVIEYPPGAGIGWHRDAPPFGVVAACSLLSSCRFRLRRGTSGRIDTTIAIEPRSGYIMSGAARTRWQHSISPTKELRYSITFRTLREKKANSNNDQGLRVRE